MKNKYCPRCIEDWEDDDGGQQEGTKVKSECGDCGGCKDCEHLLGCKYK